jgi:Bacterial transglutaminase-like N-terminal region
MPILTIRHLTTYHYKRPVSFGEHRMMLRPRDDDDQKVLESELEITPGQLALASLVSGPICWRGIDSGGHQILYMADRARAGQAISVLWIVLRGCAPSLQPRPMLVQESVSGLWASQR